MNESVIVENVSQTVIIRFNRPEKKNPLSVETLERLDRLLDELAARSSVDRIVFTGSGDTFASGANLREIAEVNEGTARNFAQRGQRLMQKIYRSPKLTVAAVDGFCLGGAFDLALSCRKRIASARSVFAHPGANLGIMTGWSGTQILPRLIGEAKALEIFLTAKRIGADEALRIGLIDAVDENPLKRAFEILN